MLSVARFTNADSTRYWMQCLGASADASSRKSSVSSSQPPSSNNSSDPRASFSREPSASGEDETAHEVHKRATSFDAGKMPSKATKKSAAHRRATELDAATLSSDSTPPPPIIEATLHSLYKPSVVRPRFSRPSLAGNKLTAEWLEALDEFAQEMATPRASQATIVPGVDVSRRHSDELHMANILSRTSFKSYTSEPQIKFPENFPPPSSRRETLL